MSRVCTIQAEAASKIINRAQLAGVDVRELCRGARFDPACLTDRDHRVPFAQIVELYHQAAFLSGDSAFGLHIGESTDPRAFDVLGYAAINSPTLGESLTRVMRYHSIWS